MLKNLKQLRAEKGISQQKLACEIGMSQQSINGYENSGVEPDISTLIRIADFFETTVDYIIEHCDMRDKCIEVGENFLSGYELAMIHKYRSLPETRRKIIDDLIEDMCAYQRDDARQA